MKTREFLQQIADLLRSQLPPELQGFHTLGPVGSLIKFHYGDPRIHYEVGVQRRIGEVEIGLHFESDPTTNQQYLERVSWHLAGGHSILGPTVEAEAWAKTWTRVHQVLPLQALEEDFLLEIASCLAGLVRTLHPIVFQPAPCSEGAET